mmetsp:Transcript_5286/g.13711  ORF Transcript_5286/g.13711 Transcript_5286/m.13711 type:complete len:313 (+) Transcript_5286:182-1120(+)
MLDHRDVAPCHRQACARKFAHAHANARADIVQRRRVRERLCHSKVVRLDEVRYVYVISNACAIPRAEVRAVNLQLGDVAKCRSKARGGHTAVAHEIGRRVLAQASFRVRAVHVEVPQDHGVEVLVGVRIVSDCILGVKFRTAVRVDGNCGRIFRDGHRDGISVRRARAAVHELVDVFVLHRTEQRDGVGRDVRPVVERVRDALAHESNRGEVHDDVDRRTSVSRVSQDASHGGLILEFDKLEAQSPSLRRVFAQDTNRPGVSSREVVEYGDSVSVLEQVHGHVASNESCATGDDDVLPVCRLVSVHIPVFVV